ncbi:MAG TPA: hypothetical protein VIS96_12740 [Terrimicrobiaceae bacterium]
MSFDSHRSLVFGSQIIALLLVVFSLIGQRAELRSQRPSSRQGDAFQDESWRVRLWDDPFRVLRELSRAEAPRGALEEISSEQELARQMVGASPESAEEALILMIVLDGRSTPEAEELRLRSRYAVVSALLTAGYRAVSDWGIWPLLARTDDQRNPVVFPLHENMVWEPFQTQKIRSRDSLGDSPSTQTTYPQVYVCWVRGDKVLSEQLLDEAARGNMVSKMRVKWPARFVIFDLGDSDRLHGFLRSVDLPKADPREVVLKRPEDVYFLHATLSNWLFKGAMNSGRSSRVVRLAQEDLYLIDALWRELKQRLPVLQRRAKCPGETLGQIVLFTESDTTYSQGIALEMQTKLLERQGNAKDARAPLDCGWKLRIFTYLRGLDGRQDSSSVRAAEAAVAHGSIEGLLNKRVLSEESSGTSQFDHLRRQAMLLKLHHLKEPVVAVGVLGSDVYDKLIVLQALRPELPQAVFFTTDLDALYLHADNVEVTRNLLVASAKGLHPETGDREDRWNVPPLRDSYQTILFEATQRLVRGQSLEDVTYQPNQEAMLFEIGAGTAVPLTPFPRDVGTTMVGWLANPYCNLVVFALALGNGILVLLAVSSRQNTPEDERKPTPLCRWARWLLAAEFAFAFLAILYLASRFFLKWIPSGAEDLLKWIRGGGEDFLMMEPLSWTLGVSIWPTIFIRCLAFLVALILLIKASQTMDVEYRLARGHLGNLLGKSARLRLSLSLELSRAALQLPRVSFARLGFKKARLQGRRSNFWSQLQRLASQKREPRAIEELLETIHSRSYRVLRITALAIVYLAISICLFTMFPTFTPGRGFTVLLVEKVTLALGIGLYVVHLLYCLDLHLGAWMLLCALREHLAKSENVDECKVLETAAEYTVAVGRTLLYPLTVLIILMLSRISLFDAWSMTPSLWIALGAGAIFLTGASLMIVSEASRMRGEAIERAREKKHEIETRGLVPGEQAVSAPLRESLQSQIGGLESRIKALQELEVGAFSHWYQQPIFAALVSLIGVLGTIGFAGPFAELLVR